jgi:hypothetical protein
MASKQKYTRLESEIERYRAEANWSKAVESAQFLATKNQGLGNCDFTLVMHIKAMVVCHPVVRDPPLPFYLAIFPGVIKMSAVHWQ